MRAEGGMIQEFVEEFLQRRRIAKAARHRKMAFLKTSPPERLETLVQRLTPEQRTVIAALLAAAEPLTNQELARRMAVSPGEASKRVTSLNGQLVKVRLGRQVHISLPQLPH